MVLRRSLCRESGVGFDEVVRVRRKLKRGRLPLAGLVRYTRSTEVLRSSVLLLLMCLVLCRRLSLFVGVDEE